MRLTVTLAAGMPRWATLHQLLERSGPFASEADGAAASHSHEAREEAARKLISNHVFVLKDVTNPTELDVTGTKELTQRELTRVAPEFTPYADQTLREVARRLLGRRPGAHQLEERLKLDNRAQANTWMQTSAYLKGRIQATPEEKLGRTPDMSVPAAAAMRAVLHEVGTEGAANPGEGHARWATLHQMLESGGGHVTLADGIASAHSHSARVEAAGALINNHMRVLKDVCNASPSENIDGVPLTQTQLKRVPAALERYADQALRETARRLLGRRPGSNELHETPDPTNESQLRAWSLTAAYLDGRIRTRALATRQPATANRHDAPLTSVAQPPGLRRVPARVMMHRVDGGGEAGTQARHE
jgi:hypothetical protein